MTDSYNFAPRRFNEFHHDYRFIEIYKYNAGEKRGISSIRAATFLITVSSAIFHPPESCHSRLFDRFQWRGGRRRDARGQRINAVRFLTRPLTVSEIQFRVSFFPFFFFFFSFNLRQSLREFLISLSLSLSLFLYSVFSAIISAPSNFYPVSREKNDQTIQIEWPLKLAKGEGTN